MHSKFTRERFRKFLSYYKPHKRIFIIDLFFAALSAVSVLLFPLISGYITKEVLGQWTDATMQKLTVAGLLLLVITIVKVISNIIYAWFGHAMGAKMEATMRSELLAHYEDLSFSFHSKNSVGKLMTVISNDLTNMTELFHHAPEDFLMTIIKFFGSFIILANINLTLTLIVFCMLPVLAIITYYADKKFEHIILINKEDLSRMNEQLEDILSGIRTVKALGNERYEAERFETQNCTYTASKCRFYRIEAFFYETLEAYPQFLTMLTVFFGALLIGNGSLDIPVLITFLLYVSSLAEPIRISMNFMKLFEGGKAAFIRFMEMIETKPSVKEVIDSQRIEHPTGEVVLDHVSFQYEDGNEKVIDDISLRIAGSQSVAFVGASGIGKTTIGALITRFYDVTDGKILIDGIDIRSINLASLRSIIGIVQQEVYIFNGTIKDNIRVGKLNASDEEIEEAARLANIHEFICSLPEQYDSMVGTKGIKLSGGQRQRISIARLFLKNPKILILDEATSALDYESEVIVQQSIDRLMEDRTTIMIAHRFSTIKNADNIFVMVDKKIIEQGTHEQLLERNGEYARLCNIGSL
jgi:ATP-binding cassette, subfamily B, bacterial